MDLGFYYPRLSFFRLLTVAPSRNSSPPYVSSSSTLSVTIAVSIVVSRAIDLQERRAIDTMLISKKNRVEVYKYLFQEGVLYAKKDYNLPKHPEIDVPNLQVIKLMQSFKSKEYVKENFAWMYYYWYLTNDGIEYLRTYLNLPSEIVPATLKKSARPPGRPMGPPSGDRPPRGPPRFEGDRPRFGDRDGYRGGPPRGPGGFGDKGGAPEGFQPSFRGSGGRPGFGRGGGGFGGGQGSQALTE